MIYVIWSSKSRFWSIFLPEYNLKSHCSLKFDLLVEEELDFKQSILENI